LGDLKKKKTNLFSICNCPGRVGCRYAEWQTGDGAAATPRHAAATENRGPQKADEDRPPLHLLFLSASSSSSPLRITLPLPLPLPLPLLGFVFLSPRHLLQSPASSSAVASSPLPVYSFLLRRDPRGHRPRLVAPQIRRCSSPAAALIRHLRAGATAFHWW
jgi:hypothetical protein